MPPLAPPPAAGAPAAPAAPRAAEVVRRLELTLGRRVDGLLHGRHLGRMPGLGSEPAESRRYVPGDDPRRMDWNVTARTTVPHVRDAVAEREATSWLVVDLSPSTDFGTARCTKRDLVVAAAGALVVLASRAGDRVGAHVLTHEGVATFPPRAGADHTRALLDAVAHAPLPDRDPAVARPGPDLDHALDRAARTAGRRGLVAVLSDFAGPGTWVPALRSLAARHEVLAVEVLDPRELDLPDVGTVVVGDVETGAVREVRTDDPVLRARYAAAARARRAATARALRGCGADHLVLRTDGDPTAALVRWLAERPRRLAHLRRAAAGGAGGRP